jgi:5-methylcytosine-specific restriction enzyme A
VSVGDTNTKGSLEQRWHREMLDIFETARSMGYDAHRFIQMVGQRGALATAHHLIDDYDDFKTSDGFRRLWELRRLDLAVEARALKPEFRSLFTSAQLTTCRRRLDLHDWRQQPPWQPPLGA